MFRSNLTPAPLLLLLAAFLTGCFRGPPALPPKSVISPPGARVIHVGVENRISCAPGYVALEKGFFGDLEVQFILLNDWGIRQNAFLAAKVQMDVTTIDAYAISSAQNMGGMLFLVLDVSNGHEGILARPEIKSLADVKGKKIAYDRATPSHFLLARFLKHNGISMDEIERLEVDDSIKAGDAISTGAADVAITTEPTLAQVAKSGKGRIIVTSATLPDKIVDVLAVNPDLLEHRKVDLQKFTNAWLKAVDYMKTHPEETNAILAKAFKTDEKEIAAMSSGTTLADNTINQQWLLPRDNSKAVQLFDSATKVWLDEKVISTPKSGKDRFIADFIENARPESIPDPVIPQSETKPEPPATPQSSGTSQQAPAAPPHKSTPPPPQHAPPTAPPK